MCWFDEIDPAKGNRLLGLCTCSSAPYCILMPTQEKEQKEKEKDLKKQGTALEKQSKSLDSREEKLRKLEEEVGGSCVLGAWASRRCAKETPCMLAHVACSCAHTPPLLFCLQLEERRNKLAELEAAAATSTKEAEDRDVALKKREIDVEAREAKMSDLDVKLQKQQVSCNSHSGGTLCT